MPIGRRPFLKNTVLAAAGTLTTLPEAIQAQARPFNVMETTIDDVHAAFRAGTLTARQLVQMYLNRINAYDKNGPAINCVISLNPQALEEADRLDAAFRQTRMMGPMHGIPILVKDEVDTAGMPTTHGTLVFKDYRPPKDAFVIDKLRKAGAIILGKSTLSEYAGGDTFGSMFGVSRNPYDLERTVGGSSGGSGGALTANFSTVTIGEETFASIRRPGSWNSCCSMRPSPGLVSRTGMWDGYPTMPAQMGPMARTVRDLALLLDGMVGYDPEDPSTAMGIGRTPASYATALDRNALRGARIGILRDAIGVATEPDSDDFKKVGVVFEKNIAELRAAGAIVIDPITIPNLRPLLAKRSGNPELGDVVLRLYLARNPNSPIKTREDIKNSPELPNSIPASKATQWRNPLQKTDWARYGEYLQAREDLSIAIQNVMAANQLDAIVHKSVEHQPTFIKDGINPPFVNNKGVPTLNTFLVHWAAMTVPSGFTTDNLPTGITFTGRPFSEATLLRLAYAYEQATHHRIPPKTTPALT